MNCVEYAPDVFAFLRAKDGFNNDELNATLDPALEANVEAIKKSGEGMGKSGSFFFFSWNKKLLIKTMTKGDFTSWNNLFREYFVHVCENPESLIAKVYGVYQVQVEGVEPQYLILMGSTAFYNPINCKKMYDLKGSLVERL